MGVTDFICWSEWLSTCKEYNGFPDSSGCNLFASASLHVCKESKLVPVCSKAMPHEA